MPDAAPFAIGRGYYEVPWNYTDGGQVDFDQARAEDNPLIAKEYEEVPTIHDTSFGRSCCILVQGLVFIWKVQIYIILLFIRTFWGKDQDMEGDIDLKAWRPLARVVQPEEMPERAKLPSTQEVSKRLFRRHGQVWLDPDISQFHAALAHVVILFFFGADKKTWNPIMTRGSYLLSTTVNNIYGVDKQVKRTGKGGKVELSEEGLPLWDADSGMFEVGHESDGNESTYRLTMYTLMYRMHNLMCDKIAAAEPNLDDEQIFQEAAKHAFYTFGKIFAVEYARNYMGIYSWGYELAIKLLMSSLSTIRANCFLYYTVGALIRFVHPGAWQPVFQEFLAFYRLHSLVPDKLGEEPIAQHVGKPTSFQRVGLAKSVAWLANSPSGSLGLKNTPVVLNNDYLDVDHLALQRHREIKLGSINDFRSRIGLPSISWNRFSAHPTWNKTMQELYQDSDDVDWMVGLQASCRQLSTTGSGVAGIDMMGVALHFILNGFMSSTELIVPQAGPEKYDFTLTLAELITQTTSAQEEKLAFRTEDQGGVTRLRPLNANFQTCFGRMVYTILNLTFALALLTTLLLVGFFMVAKALPRKLGLGWLNLHNVFLALAKAVCMCMASFIFRL